MTPECCLLQARIEEEGRDVTLIAIVVVIGGFSCLGTCLVYAIPYIFGSLI